MLGKVSPSNNGIKNSLLALLVLPAALSLTGCGGGGGGDADIQATNTTLRSDPPPSLVINEEFFETAMFLKTPVAGLNYSADSFSGTTDAAGGLRYAAGEEITFQLGSINLGTSFGTSGMGTIALADLILSDNESDNELAQTQLLQLLFSFDNDADPSNGLHLGQNTVEHLNQLSIELALGSPEFLKTPELLQALQTHTNRSAWVSAEEVLEYYDVSDIE